MLKWAEKQSSSSLKITLPHADTSITKKTVKNYSTVYRKQLLMQQLLQDLTDLYKTQYAYIFSKVKNFGKK